jgi:hypothetical protein
MTKIIGHGGPRSGKRLPRSWHGSWRLGMSMLLMVLMHRVILLSTISSGLSIALLLLGFLLFVFVLILKKIANVLLIYSFRGLLQRENGLYVTTK